jgi:thymidylate synthase (FAD)
MEFIEPDGFEEWNYAESIMFEDICERSEQAYAVMLNYKLKPQQARAVLPNALKTEIVVTCDRVEWAHIFKLRCAPSAHPDFRRLAIPLRDRFQEEGLL